MMASGFTYCGWITEDHDKEENAKGVENAGGEKEGEDDGDGLKVDGDEVEEYVGEENEEEEEEDVCARFEVENEFSWSTIRPANDTASGILYNLTAFRARRNASSSLVLRP
eukprot:GILK01009133.1.p2 GENE.GILK01009133.1~~GILK01009133.1.p2  ORF type:complete len:111 (-),score=21.87 GILK01009133.1:84-416(-)